MRQLKAEYYKMKYSRASKWVLVFMAFIFFIPFVVGNDTLFMTFGDYRNIDSIGWICYIDDMNNVKAAEIARFALSINFFSWIGLIVYITTMVSAEFHQGTIRASVVYGINRTKLFLSKLLVINVHFFILYYIVETALGLGLAWKYGFHYKGEEFLIFIGMVTLNMIAMIGMEAVAVLITVLVKNTGIVAALSCVYFFAGAITYPITVIIQKEYQDNTLRNVLLAPTSRTDFVISKIVIWALWYVITLGLIEVVIGAGLYILYPQEFNLKNLGYTIYFLTEYGIFSFISMLPILWVAFKQKHLFYPSMLITLGFTALELAGRQVNEEMLELASICPWTAVSVSGMVEVKSIHFWICAVSIFICGVVGILGSVSTFKKQNL